eukprot:3374939-Ditylum_brightwellii.AAC.1
MIAIAQAETTNNIAWAGITTTTFKTAHTQAEIATAAAEATTMPTKIVKVIDMTIIMTRDAEEALV